jgi:hypothetical protein
MHSYSHSGFVRMHSHRRLSHMYLRQPCAHTIRLRPSSHMSRPWLLCRKSPAEVVGRNWEQIWNTLRRLRGSLLLWHVHTQE